MLCNFNSRKQEDYVALLYNNNFKNDFDTAIANTKIQADQLYSRCIYSNINNRKQNLILKLLSAIDNIKLAIIIISRTIFSIITYYSKGCLIFLNDYKNSSYFPIAFPILFLFEDGKHLKNK